MAWVYVPLVCFQEQEVSTSLLSGPASGPSAMSKTIPTLKGYLCPECVIDNLMKALSGMMCEHFMGAGVVGWMLSMVASLAKTSPLSAEDKESKTASKAPCGLSSNASYAKWDQNSSWWKTSQVSLWGGTIGLVLGHLSEMGFNAKWGTYGACQFGAPHMRQRVFIVAYANGIRWIGMDQDKKEFGRRKYGKVPLPWRDKPSHLLHDVERIITNPRKGIHRMDDGLAEELDCFRCLGNGVVPQQAIPAFQKIIEMSSYE